MNINFTTLFAQQCCVGICCCFDLCAFSWVKKGANSLPKKQKKRSVQIVLLVLLLSLLFQISSTSAIISFSSLLDFQGGKKRCSQSRNLFIYLKYYTTCL